MTAEQLVRRILLQNVAGRSRSAAATLSVLESVTTGGELDVDELFRRLTDDAGERDGASGATGEAEPVGGDTGGAAASA